MAILPQKDEEYLREKGFVYEVQQTPTTIGLILRNWPFPEQYDHTTADVLILIPPAYPLAQIDMFYTYPTIKLRNGGTPVNADQPLNFGDRTWQRWSRHHAWREGKDSIRSFITAMTLEIKKGI